MNPELYGLVVGWTGVIEAAAVKAQQRRLAAERAIQTGRCRRGELAERVLDALAGQDWLTCKEIAVRMARNPGDINAACYGLVLRGALERERPGNKRRRGMPPQRYRIRRQA